MSSRTRMNEVGLKTAWWRRDTSCWARNYVVDIENERLRSRRHGWVEDERSRSNGHSWVGDEQLGSKGPSETSNQVREDMMEVGQTVVLGLTQWGLETSGRAQKDLVEAGDERSDSRGHGGGGIQVVALE